MFEFIKNLVPIKLRAQIARIKLRFLSSTLTGSKFRCNICDRSWKRLFPFGSRSNAMCPSCMSLERHRLLFFYLKNETNVLDGNCALLHFAPERCLFGIFHKCKSLDYYTADLMNQHIPGLEVMPQFVMSVTDISFPSDKFDYLICSHVLEHVRYDTVAMGEIIRVLKPGGLAFLQVPIKPGAIAIDEDFTLGPEERQARYGYSDHVRYYSEKGYVDRLTSCGFEVKVCDYVKSLDACLYALDSSEKLFLCKKRS